MHKILNLSSLVHLLLAQVYLVSILNKFNSIVKYVKYLLSFKNIHNISELDILEMFFRMFYILIQKFNIFILHLY